MFTGYRVVWGDEKTLEMDNGDGCTTLQICLIKWNYLKIAKMVNFISILLQKKKRSYKKARSLTWGNPL